MGQAWAAWVAITFMVGPNLSFSSVSFHKYTTKLYLVRWDYVLMLSDDSWYTCRALRSRHGIVSSIGAGTRDFWSTYWSCICDKWIEFLRCVDQKWDGWCGQYHSIAPFLTYMIPIDSNMLHVNIPHSKTSTHAWLFLINQMGFAVFTETISFYSADYRSRVDRSALHFTLRP